MRLKNCRRQHDKRGPQVNFQGNTATDELLHVEELTKYFPITGGLFQKVVAQVKAVDGVSFSIRRGETLGLVGELGCGKTTVGQSILRLIEPTSGSIYFEGKDILKANHKELKSLRRDMQIIFQDPFSSLDPRRMVGDAICDGVKYS